MSINPKIEPSWKAVLKEEFSKPYFSSLKSFLVKEKQKGVKVFPPGQLLFNAFACCPYEKLQVVILGQDPYHGPGQAHGLCFSVPAGVPSPPSLVNIFKELQADCHIPVPAHGSLDNSANQGVLLLNSILTVEARKPLSHAKHGWEQFTDAVISIINKHKENTVFLLWGKPAQEKGSIIDTSRHLVLKAPHPSPFSANRGFFGCRHFSQTNLFLVKQGQKPIDWHL